MKRRFVPATDMYLGIALAFSLSLYMDDLPIFVAIGVTVLLYFLEVTYKVSRRG